MAVFKTPSKCNECGFIRHYTDGIWSENPHHCCDLMWTLYEENYNVDPDSMDDYCPLNDIIIAAVGEE